MPAPKKNKKKQTLQFSLSSAPPSDFEQSPHHKKITCDVINDVELQRALDKWSKEHSYENNIVSRDLGMLRSHISEYLDTFLLLGYDMEGRRVVIQNFSTARDKDALVEFLKNIFIQQQQGNFLDI